MVRKTGGGGHANRQGRKCTTTNTSNVIRKSENVLEEYACATKMNGNGISVTTHTGKELFCHMRGKFTGRNRRQNFISVGTWLLVGMRDWEKEQKNCDLIVVYDKDEVNELRNLPGNNLNYLIKITNRISQFLDKDVEEDIEEEEEEDGFKFSENVEISEEYKKMLETGTDTVINDSIEETIDIEDL